jgi:hypothetical protein
VQSPLFELAYIAEEAFRFPKDAKPDDPRRSVSDGYWIKIAGLSLGENTQISILLLAVTAVILTRIGSNTIIKENTAILAYYFLTAGVIWTLSLHIRKRILPSALARILPYAYIHIHIHKTLRTLAITEKLGFCCSISDRHAFALYDI